MAREHGSSQRMRTRQLTRERASTAIDTIDSKWYHQPRIPVDREGASIQFMLSPPSEREYVPLCHLKDPNHERGGRDSIATKYHL